jgi:outer membrane protein OmpA-like peptidoglycan-associated protein
LQIPRFLLSLLIAASLGATAPAAAQQVRLHGYGAGAHAVGGHQQHELGWGSTVRASAEWVIVREFGLVLQGSGTFLGAGELPDNASLAPLDAAKGWGAEVGFHLRPFARKTYGKIVSPAGFWLGGAGGVNFTGGERRPMADASIGFDFLFKAAKFGIGPMLGWEWVYQPNDELRPADANILFAGLHGMLELGKAQGNIDGDVDEDGIRDSLDQCPTNPEDKDGFEDKDGCPDPDNDKDGVLDKADQCPLEAEDKDGYRDADGCPELDNDHDGIADVKDKCPNDAEDKDSFEDEDGCPDPDNDKDGIPDKEDLCPNEAETMNGYADHDGCPDAQQIRVVGDKIVLDDRVHFMINSHIIRRISFDLLERLAKLINEHPEYVHIEIQGHTDERGPTWYNERLSQTRAASVMAFLVKSGVNAERLSAKGFGQSKPLVQKRTEYAYYMNRRVEFEITREIRQKATDGEPTSPSILLPKIPSVSEDNLPDEAPPEPPLLPGEEVPSESKEAP